MARQVGERVVHDAAKMASSIVVKGGTPPCEHRCLRLAGVFAAMGNGEEAEREEKEVRAEWPLK
eukprot:8070457-Pyramimonas_sp.AAC.1